MLGVAIKLMKNVVHLWKPNFFLPTTKSVLHAIQATNGPNGPLWVARSFGG
jgi:hypothetical protein